MRRILVDNARRKRAEIHGGGRRRVELAEGDWISRATPDEIVAIDESLARLAEDDPEAAELVKLRLFAGMSVEEAGQVPRHVPRDGLSALEIRQGLAAGRAARLRPRYRGPFRVSTFFLGA